MDEVFIEGRSFDRIDYKTHIPEKGEYDACRFINCDFSSSDLSEIKFIGCEFIACNLSLTGLAKTSFREVIFKECKMLGLRFDHCNTFGLSLSFDNCNLTHSSFFQAKLHKTLFRKCRLAECDLTGSDLTGSVFEDCDFTNAMFENTIIEKADFRTSYNFSIDPDNNRIKKAKFSLAGIPGLLDKYNIEIS